MPKYQMRVDDSALAVNQIKVDIKERLNSFFIETDHHFALDNYEYVTKTLNNDMIMKIYKQLGPFDFFQEPAKLDATDELSEKSMQERFDKRRSGAMFRGELN